MLRDKQAEMKERVEKRKRHDPKLKRNKFVANYTAGMTAKQAAIVAGFSAKSADAKGAQLKAEPEAGGHQRTAGEIRESTDASHAIVCCGVAARDSRAQHAPRRIECCPHGFGIA